MLLQQGTVSLRGSTSYHQQSSWIFNDTLKNNILFGQPYDESRFNEVLRVACLAADIKALPDGIDTEIGEKGINLSGGQKARGKIKRSSPTHTETLLLTPDVPPTKITQCLSLGPSTATVMCMLSTTP